MKNNIEKYAFTALFLVKSSFCYHEIKKTVKKFG